MTVIVTMALFGSLSQNAIASTKFLLKVENSNMPMTQNHYFNDNLQKR